MKIGRFEVYPLLDGFFGLDGGAMFGTVPKVIWQKTNPADERNRILLALRPLLIKTPNELILVDTGIGDKFNSKFQDIYKVEKSCSIEDSLRKLKIALDDIEIVINTHLHFDHAGGNTKINRFNEPEPKFSKAKYFIQKSEWEYATNPDRRSQASYLKEDFIPLLENGNLSLVFGNTEITEGIEVMHTGGHTVGHQVVLIKSNEARAIYWGDLIPTASHLKIPYVMGYDLFPLQTMKVKEELISQAIKEQWVLIFEHDPKEAIVKIVSEDKLISLE